MTNRHHLRPPVSPAYPPSLGWTITSKIWKSHSLTVLMAAISPQRETASSYQPLSWKIPDTLSRRSHFPPLPHVTTPHGHGRYLYQHRPAVRALPSLPSDESDLFLHCPHPDIIIILNRHLYFHYSYPFSCNRDAFITSNLVCCCMV